MTPVRIPPTLRAETGGQRQVEAEGATVAELLEDLTSRFPGLGNQLQYANVYLDGEDVRTLDGDDTPVGAGSTLILLPAMAGGSLTPLAALRSWPAEPASAEG